MPHRATPDRDSIGAYIRSQRELSRMSLRELARLSQVSNAYLSQVERGLHEPSVRVLRAVAKAMSIPFDDLVQRASPGDDGGRPDPLGCTVDVAIRSDPRLTQTQKNALIVVYESFLAARDPLPSA